MWVDKAVFAPIILHLSLSGFKPRLHTVFTLREVVPNVTAQFNIPRALLIIEMI